MAPKISVVSKQSLPIFSYSTYREQLPKFRAIQRRIYAVLPRDDYCFKPTPNVSEKEILSFTKKTIEEVRETVESLDRFVRTYIRFSFNRIDILSRKFHTNRTYDHLHNRFRKITTHTTHESE